MARDTIRKLEATREKYRDVRKAMDCDRRYEIRCNDRGLSRRHGARSARDRKIAITFSAWIIYSSSRSYLPHVHVTQARVKHPLFRNYIHNCVRMKYTNYVHITRAYIFCNRKYILLSLNIRFQIFLLLNQSGQNCVTNCVRKLKIWKILFTSEYLISNRQLAREAESYFIINVIFLLSYDGIRSLHTFATSVWMQLCLFVRGGSRLKFSLSCRSRFSTFVECRAWINR